MELRKFMKDNDVDVSLFFCMDSVLPDVNMEHYSGYNGTGILILPQKKKPFLVVTQMDAGKVHGTDHIVFKSGKMCEFLKKSMKKRGVRQKKVGVDYRTLSVSAYKRLSRKLGGRYVDISKAVIMDRMIKNTNGVEGIRKSCQLASLLIKNCIGRFRKFSTELQVKNYLEFEAKKRGAVVAFPTIVGSGKGGAIPHYEGNGKLRKGFCVLDFGVRYKGYCSDISRTIYLGKPSAGEIENYNLLLSVQKKAISDVKAGLKIKKLAASVRKNLGEKEKYFIHGLGHGVGLEVHEGPNVSRKSKDTFQRGMVFTIEPGLYFSGKYGIRIEDTMYLGKKIEILTKVKKDLIII